MTAKAALCPNPCETCAKEGLPLLLTRYALMPADAKAPKLSGNLNAPELDQVPLGETAHYGLRLLRSGYVYVFDEKRKHWDEYFVTSDGVLAKRPPRIMAFKARQVPPATEFACARNGAAPLAGVITIRNPKHAGKIWIAFSSVEWTHAVFAAHETESHRRKHMTCITITDGKVAAQQHTAPLEEADRHVPEFRFRNDADRVSWNHQRAGKDSLDFEMVVKKMAKGFNWNPFEFNSYLARKEAFLEGVKNARPQGGAAIVALHDPVGLAMEIAALMEMRKTQYMAKDAAQRFAANSIVSLESTIREQAKLARIQTTVNREAAAMGEFGHMVDTDVALMNLRPAELKAAADNEWKKYTHDRNGNPRFQHKHSQIWLGLDKTELQTFDRANIAPLAKAHVAWLQHRCMVGHMSCNYDSADKDSGVAYTATFVDLLLYTTDKQANYDLYLKWISAGDYSDSNLAMRAIGFNQTELIDKLKTTDAAPVDGRAFPTDAAAGAVAAFMEKMPTGAQAQLTALLAGLNGPALKYWNDFSAGKIGGKAAAAMAAVSGKQFVRMPIVGNKGQFIQAYMRELYKLDPDLKVKPNQLQAAIAKQVTLLEMEGVKMNSRSTLGWYVLLDKEALASATSKNLSGQALANELVKTMRRPADIQKLDMAKAARFRNVAYGGATALGGLFMALNFTKLLEDVENGMSHDLEEAKTKLWIGGIAIGGFVAEQVGNGLEKIGETRLRNMAGKVGAAAPRALQLFGRLAGLGTGVFLGIWDVMKGVEARRNGDAGLSNAYIASGTAAAAVATTMFAVSMGWLVLGLGGWIVVAAGVLIWLVATYFVETKKDNPRQEWLSRCHFGAAPESERYGDVNTHAEQYKRALAA